MRTNSYVTPFRLLAGAVLAMAATAAHAETLMMPNRDAIRGSQVVVWGVTTLPNHTAANPTQYTIDFGDGTSTSGNVTDRSYIAVLKTYGSGQPPGTHAYTATLTVTNGASVETATVEIRVVDPDTLGAGSVVSPVGPGSNEQYRNLRINMAIEDGLRFLWTSQNSRTAAFPTGTMTSWGNNQPYTALVITAFQNHGYRLPSDPAMPPTGLYEKYIVQRGLNFILQNTSVVAIAAQAANAAHTPPLPARDPCVPATMPSPCSGLRPTAGQPGYTIGIAMLPLSASGALQRTNGAFGPALIQGATYRDVLQRMANLYAWGQIDTNTAHRGGWGYEMNTTTLDGSVMGWGILGLLDAQAAGIVVPEWVRTELVHGINGAWNSNGSFDYNADGNPAAHVYSGMEKAGVGLQGMFMTGELGGTRVDATRDYISARWTAAGRVAPDNAYWANCNGFPTNFSCAYSMFNNFKGLKLQNIGTLSGVTRLAGPGAIPAGDWHADYEDWFVNNQVNPTTAAGGSWNMRFSNFGNDTNGNVAIAELILSGVALVLPDAERFATVGLSPAVATLVEGNTHTVTARAESESGAPVPGATVTFEILSGPNAGLTATAVTDANGEATFTYTDAGPIPSFGTDRIQASIGALESNIVQMIWTAFNRPPQALDNAYAVDEDHALAGNVQTDAPPDIDPDEDTLATTLIAGPAHGTLVLNADGSFTYTPVPDFFGSDSFIYRLNDGMFDSNTATVTIAVNEVNDAPVAADTAATTAEDTPVSGQVTASDVDGPPATFAAASTPSNGSVVVNGDGTFTYTPAANFCGADSFTFNASDGSLSDTGTVSITVICVNDGPVFTPPADITVSTGDPTGIAVTFAATGTDPEQGVIPAVCVPPSGATFVIGPTTVACTVTDDGGLTASGSFTVTVLLAGSTKNAPPTVTVPGPIVIVTNQPDGAIVTFVATATDPEDGPVAVTCTPPSGSLFPVGDTRVLCSAQDSGGLVSTAKINVGVIRNRLPQIAWPASVISASATSPAGAAVTYSVTATDKEDGTVPVTCVPPSGSTFPIGKTTVTCSATDSHGGSSTATFQVQVTNAAPTLLVPPAIEKPATDALGALVTYEVAAKDPEEGDLVAVCTPASGSLFPIGSTIVTCSVTDRAGATTTRQFPVKVR